MIAASLVVPHLAINVFDIIIKIAGAMLGPLLGLFLLGMLGAPRQCPRRVARPGCRHALPARRHPQSSFALVVWRGDLRADGGRSAPWPACCLPRLRSTRSRGCSPGPARHAVKNPPRKRWRSSETCQPEESIVRTIACCWIVLGFLPTAAATAAEVSFADVTAEAGLTRDLVGLTTTPWPGATSTAMAGSTCSWATSPTGFDAALGQKAAVPNQLFRQGAGGKFEPFPSPPVEIPARCSGAVFVDLDNDGDLDLYVSSNRLEQAAAEGPRPTRRAERAASSIATTAAASSSTSPRAAAPARRRCSAAATLACSTMTATACSTCSSCRTALVRQGDKVSGSRLFRNLGESPVRGRHGQGRPAGRPLGRGHRRRRPQRRPPARLLRCAQQPAVPQPAGRDLPRKPERCAAVFDHQPKDSEDFVAGAAFGDLDHDGDLDLITGPHHYHGPSRVHVFLNEGSGRRAAVPRDHEGAGHPALPQKAPHPEIQDFDNDGIPDLYWSACFAEGEKRWPFLCRGLGVKDGLPRFAVPDVPR